MEHVVTEWLFNFPGQKQNEALNQGFILYPINVCLSLDSQWNITSNDIFITKGEFD